MGFGKHLRKNWYTSGMSIVEFFGGFTSGSGNIVFTPTTPPVVGDFICVQLASTNITDWAAEITSPVGFVRMIASNNRTCLWYKVATASEPSSYTFNNPASGGKGYEYMNFRGLMPMSAIQSIDPLTSGTYPGTYSSTPMNIDKPGIALSVLGKSTTTIWTASAGWTTLSASGQAKAAYKIYTDIALGEVLTWALSPPGATSTVLTTTTFLFPCKFNQN